MRFGLCVRLGVDLHVRLTEEGRRTHPAPTGGETQKWEGAMEGQEEEEDGRVNMEKKKKKRRRDGRLWKEKKEGVTTVVRGVTEQWPTKRNQTRRVMKINNKRVGDMTDKWR